MRGNVNWYNEEEGYGFITNEYGEYLFVHKSFLNARDFPDRILRE